MSIRRRLASFNDNWRSDILAPLDMAIAGFSYLDIGDKVKCDQCNKIFHSWDQSDNPLQKHIRVSPDCPFIIRVISTFNGRLKTFHNWPVLLVRPDDLAEAGFYYLGVGDNVKCIECYKIFCDWQQSNNPLQEHIIRSPYCSFIKKFLLTISGRVKTFHNWPINVIRPGDTAEAGLYYLGTGSRVKCIECETEIFGWTGRSNPLQEHIIRSPDCSFIKKIVLTVNGRLKTFHNWPVNFLRPDNMAEAGFFYTGIGRRVKCFKCLVYIDSWQLGVVPTTEHMRYSPLCSYVRGNREIFDECGSLGAIDILNKIEAKYIDDSLDSGGIVVKLKHVMNKYGNMSSINARLETFAGCVRIFEQDINTLCEAGFFYDGDGETDFVTCFFCSVRLSMWEDGDEPWIEHAKWSKTCAYVKLNKGKNFVAQVLGVDNDVIEYNQLELFKLIAKQENTCILGTTMKIRISEKQINRLNCPKPLIGKNQQHLSQKLNTNSVPDCMECKICFKGEIKVVFVPCGHAVACIECALTITQCAVCRHPFSKLIRIYLFMDERNYEDRQLQPCSSKMSFSDKLNPMLCKTCHNEDMSAVFLPCQHVYNCIKCAEKTDECAICAENVFAFIHLFL